MKHIRVRGERLCVGPWRWKWRIEWM